MENKIQDLGEILTEEFRKYNFQEKKQNKNKYSI